MVAALRRVYKHVQGGDQPRIFRQEMYRSMATSEPVAWELCGTPEQRQHALNVGARGTRPHPDVSQAWDEALCRAFDGLEFDHVVANRGGLPNGFSTVHLITKQVCHHSMSWS